MPPLPVRLSESHKGDFGRVLLVGGAVGMAGAISLSGLAALRAGAGLVKLAVPAETQTTVATFSPAYMTIGCASQDGTFQESAWAAVEEELAWANVVGIGPGMGRGVAQQKMIGQLYKNAAQPLVVDADGLNGLADAKFDLTEHAGPRILTPHPGEMQRLLGSDIDDRKRLEECAAELAGEANIVLVLKGHQTLVTDGHTTTFNTTGNSGMATAGSGDVLTGLITALVGQGMTPWSAARLGVHLHGLAGDIVANKMGQFSLIATDLIDELAAAFKQYELD